MHILLIHQAFAAIDEPGGTRHYELANHLVNKGHKVTVVTSTISYLTGKSETPISKKDEAILGSKSFRIIRVATFNALHQSFVHRTINFFSFMVASFFVALRVKRIDLVWGTSPPIFQGFTAWLVAFLKNKPFVFEVRDLWPAFAVQVGVLRNRILIKLSEWLEKFLYRKADRVIVNSPGFVEHVSKRGAKSIELIPNGSDPEMFQSKISGLSFREKHGLLDKHIVLYAGAFGISNDLSVLLEAAGLLSNDKDIFFVLVGDGKEKNNLLIKTEQMQLSNVCFYPPVPKTEMPQVIAAADACIAILKPLPLYATVYPNKVFDYMAMGKPVILAIEGVIRQLIEEAQAGLAVTPGNSQLLAEAIQWLKDHPQKALAMGKNGRQYVSQKFNRTHTADKLCDLFEGFVANN